MKKGLFIAAGVIALLAVMVWADHKFPAAGAPGSSAPSKPTEAPTVALKDLNDKDVTIQDYKINSGLTAETLGQKPANTKPTILPAPAPQRPTNN